MHLLLQIRRQGNPRAGGGIGAPLAPVFGDCSRPWRGPDRCVDDRLQFNDEAAASAEPCISTKFSALS